MAEPPTQDLSPDDFSLIDWKDDKNTNESMDKLFQEAMDYAKEASCWYWRAKHKKKFAAGGVRIIIVVLLALANVVPILVQLEYFDKWLQPIHATAFLGLAGVFLGFDRYLGWSKGWIRYVLAATELTEMMDDFSFDWEVLRAKRKANQSAESRSKEIEAIKTFVASRNEIVRRETEQWSTDFMSVVKQLEQITEKKQKP